MRLRMLFLLIPIALAAYVLTSCTYPIGQGGYGNRATAPTIELYDAGGKHLGYGKANGGMVDIFRPDGSRLGYGKTGR